MQWLARAELASAVSNAGGLGIIAAAGFSSADDLRREIRKTKSLTGNPFAVNFTLMPTRQTFGQPQFDDLQLPGWDE